MKLLAAHDRMDIVFANAGIETGDGSIESIALESWAGILDVNLTGVMLTARAGVDDDETQSGRARRGRSSSTAR